VDIPPKIRGVMATAAGERILPKETTVSAPISRVWWAWTTSEGLASWWVKQSWIELRVGGPFELYFLPDERRGVQGTEGCRVLSYRPPEMLSFSWNFPPTLPEIRSEHTWAVLRFASVGRGKTKVTLDQLGWKAGRAWNAGWRYFDVAWGNVFAAFRTRFPAAEAGSKRS
jgi:uncharacterized protein YndB with AHSA1/START domain